MSESRHDADKPGWFERVLAMTPESCQVRVQDCDIHYLRWGLEGASLPGLLFLHAGGAHERWWSFLAPFFAHGRPVAALDFSGMGESGRRPVYTSAAHVAEIAAVLEDAVLGAAPVVVGHSFGCYMAMCHGHQFGWNLHGIVFVDTALRPHAETVLEPVKAYDRPPKHYADRATILRRFRLGPTQPCDNRYLLDFIAEHSITRCRLRMDLEVRWGGTRGGTSRGTAG